MADQIQEQNPNQERSQSVDVKQVVAFYKII